MTSQTIWGSTDRGPAAGTMRLPVDINSTSSPGYLSMTEVATFVWASPTLVMPVLGVATATSINKLILTQPATGATLTIADGATLTASASATISNTNTGDQTDATLTFTDITTNNVSTSKHGFAPKSPNDATKYLDGTGAYSVPASGGAGTVNAGTIGQMSYYAASGTAVSGNANATISAGAMTLGVSGSVIGTLVLAGNTSGAVTIIPQAAAGTWNFNLPITAGTAGSILTSQGGGSNAMTWSAVGTGNVTGPVSSTNTAIALYSGTAGQTLLNSLVLIDSSGNITGAGTVASGAHIVTSANASALIIGANGSTNPVLQIDSSASSVTTGISIIGAASNGGVKIQALSGQGQESITIAAKSTGSISFQSGGNNRLVINQSNFVWTPTVLGTAATARMLYTGSADTGLTLSTEAPSWYINLGQTRQHATGAITLQRDFRITGTTHSFLAASTITDAASLSVDGAPIGGTNATITNSHAIYIPTIALSNVTNGYGLTVAAPTGGATINAALNCIGDALHAGNIKLGTAGNGLYIKSGSNSRIGTATLTGGTVTVSNSSVTANTRVFLQDTTSGSLTNVGTLTVVTNAGSNFVVTSSNPLDTSTFNWILIESM